MDWKLFHTTDKTYKANLIKDILMNSGIECKEISKKDSGLKIGSIELYVLEKDKTKATEIIENHPEL